MEVRLKIGRYAGEIQDFAPDVAKGLIDSGHATDPRFENEPAIAAGAAAVAPAKPAKPAKKKGSR